MTTARARLERALRGVTVSAGAIAVLAFSACIIAEPVSEITQLPSFRPIIVRSSAVPVSNAILGAFPAKFVVPVELVDPSVTFGWRLYIDYNPVTGEGLDSYADSLPGAGDAGIRVLEIQTTTPADLTRCHVVEVLVAQEFQDRGEFRGKNAHTPVDPPGGDSITWIYSPSGDLTGCPVPDAGVAVPRDAGLDAEGGS